MDRKIGDIFETQDYGKFKHLEGNRTDAARRGEKIISSIRSVGYILSPIAVNEKYEVIDGQGRLYALEQEGLPVHYYVVCGAGIDDCIAMNIYGTKWKLEDYINSYASRGNLNYVTLVQMMDTYKATLGLKTIIYAITMNSWGSSSRGPVEKGNFIISEDVYKKAVERLNYCMKASPFIGKLSGRKDHAYAALIFIFDHYSADEVDKSKLLTKLEYQWNQITPIADVSGALKNLSDIYNFRSRGPQMRFDVDYDKHMCDTVPGYSGKWSKAKR